MPTQNYTVAAALDNGWEEGGATWNGGEIYFGQYSGPTTERGAFRFLTVAVPQGTALTSATLTMRALGGFNTSAFADLSLLWRAQAIDDAAAPASGNRPSTWSVTTAGTTFTLPSWTVGNDYSWDVTSVIQEIVNRAGWVSGNDLNITANGTHSGTPEMQFTDYTSSATFCPRLQIVWPDAGGSLLIPPRRMPMAILAR